MAFDLKSASDTFKENPGFFAFGFGVVFLICLVVVAIFVREPSKFQYDVFRVVLALAGGGFAAAMAGYLKVLLPLPQNGQVEAAAGFAVFIILFFFSPAGWVVTSTARAVIEKKYAYDMHGGEIKTARAKIEEIFAVAEFSQLAETVARASEQGDIGSVVSARERLVSFIESGLNEGDRRASMFKVADFYVDVATCVRGNLCDAELACKEFTRDIERFRWSFCHQLGQRDASFRHEAVKILNQFATNDCRIHFVSHYVGFQIASERPICLPTTCWSHVGEDRLICGKGKSMPSIVFGRATP